MSSLQKVGLTLCLGRNAVLCQYLWDSRKKTQILKKNIEILEKTQADGLKTSFLGEIFNTLTGGSDIS